MPAPSTTPLRPALLALYLGLLLATLLNAAGLRERLIAAPEGDGQALALALVEPLAARATVLGLDRPRALLRAWAGRREEGATPAAVSLSLVVEAPAPLPPTTVTIEAPRLREVNAEAPLRVWVIGDSLINMGGPRVKELLEQTGLARVEVNSRPSTGLARPDYFDWPGAVRRRMAAGDRPEAVVVLMGANDGQNMRVEGRSEARWSAAWMTEYQRRVGGLMTLLEGAQVYWLGLPGMESATRQHTADLLNAAIAAEAPQHLGIRFVETEGAFSRDGARFSLHLIGPNGARFPARAGDGVHFTWSGSRVLAGLVVSAMAEDWPALSGAAPARY